MKKYKVTATHFEYLHEMVIEANNKAEARDIYLDKWDCGEILCTNNRVGHFKFEVTN